MACIQSPADESCRFFGVGSQDPGNLERSGNRTCQHLGALAIAPRNKRAFVFPIEAIKEEKRKWKFLTDGRHIFATAQTSHGDLKWMGSAVGTQRNGFTFEEKVSNRQRPGPFDDLGYTISDILQLSREDTNFIALTVKLDSCPVELEFKRSRAHPIQRFRWIFGAVGQHRRYWHKQPKTETCEPRGPLLQSGSCYFPKVSRE